MIDNPVRQVAGGQYATRAYAVGIPSAVNRAGRVGEEIQPTWLAQSSEMPLHGICFMGAGVAWSFIAILTQQSSIAACAASIQVDGSGGI
ncbi:MAG: hypothetical protein ACREDD_00865 [Methylocella sp.]